MTHNQFYLKLNYIINGTQLFGTIDNLTLNSLIYIIREKMYMNCSLSSSNGLCITSTNAFVPVRHLAKHVSNIYFYDEYNCIFFDFVEEDE